MNVYLLTLDITLDGGVERVVSNMANHLTTDSYDVHIISIFHANNNIHYNINDRIKLHYLYHFSYSIWIKKNRFIIGNLLKNLWLSFCYTNKLYSYISRHSRGEKSIVICSDYLRLPSKKKENVYLIGEDHSRYPFGGVTKGLLNYLRTINTKNLDYVVTLNSGELHLWKSLKKPVSVIPNFIPKEQCYFMSHSSDREKVILSIGRMNTNQKGFDRLISTFSLIAKKYPDWKLRIFGSGKLQQHYLQMVEELQLNESVEIRDYTSNPAIEYKKASIYAMCSREEGFGMVLLEASMCGLPLIAYDSDLGPNSIIKNGDTGFLIEDGDSVSFSKHLEVLINDLELRRKFVEESQKDIMNRYSEESVMLKWKDLFNELTK